MANPTEWGPPFWRVLHTLAERLGRQTHSITINDERRAWYNFIRSVESALPCAKCKEHFHSWKRAHPIERVHQLAGDPLRNWVREWLWQLHKEVNDERGVESPTLEEVKTLYESRTGTEQMEDIRQLHSHLTKSMQLRLVAPDAIHTFRTNLSMIMRLVF